MRIIEISVEGLFGIFNHRIPLNLEDRITIIHGPNGFGKTILLKMVYGLFNRRYSELRNIPFLKLEIKFDDGNLVWVERTKRKDKQTQSLFPDEEDGNGTRHKKPKKLGQFQTVAVNWLASNTQEPKAFSLPASSTGEIPTHFIERFDKIVPRLERISQRKWLYLPTREILSPEDIIDRFGHILQFDILPEPDWWTDFQSSVRVHLIEAQRLLNLGSKNSDILHSRPGTILVVEQYASELAEKIQKKLAESAAISQSLDRSFPARLVEKLGKSKLTDDELRQKLSELEEKRTRLKEAGFLEKEEDGAFLPKREIAGSTKEVLEVYVEDVEQKLGVFDGLTQRIDLFRKIINNRFMHKELAISKLTGFSFTTIDGKPLPPTALSSGEQHELVLLYQLLFKVHAGSLILIDEPELSLHVAWQKQFLRDLQEITKLSAFDVLIATHSPQIIHDRWDLTVELKGPAGS